MYDTVLLLLSLNKNKLGCWSLDLVKQLPGKTTKLTAALKYYDNRSKYYSINLCFFFSSYRNIFTRNTWVSCSFYFHIVAVLVCGA